MLILLPQPLVLVHLRNPSLPQVKLLVLIPDSLLIDADFIDIEAILLLQLLAVGLELLELFGPVLELLQVLPQGAVLVDELGVAASLAVVGLLQRLQLPLCPAQAARQLVQFQDEVQRLVGCRCARCRCGALRLGGL